jgi:hypothetical protein
MSHPLPPKKEVALALLERSSVHVHLDPRAAGVVVPLFLKSQPQLVLQIGLNMPVPIPDLRLDEAGMTCTLSFNRSPFYCVIPWSSIFAMIGDDGRGMIWKDDVPPEVAKPSQARPDRPAAAPAEIAGRPLRAAPNPRDSEAAAGASGGAGASAGKRAGGGASDAKAEARVKVAKKPRKRVERPKDGTEPRHARGSEGRSGGRETGKDARGGLSAVPSPSPAASSGNGDGASSGSGAERPARKPAAEKRPAARPAPARDEMPPPAVGGAGGAGAARPAARRPGAPSGPSRPKRELPPYLRVVK